MQQKPRSCKLQSQRNCDGLEYTVSLRCPPDKYTGVMTIYKLSSDLTEGKLRPRSISGGIPPRLLLCPV